MSVLKRCSVLLERIISAHTSSAFNVADSSAWSNKPWQILMTPDLSPDHYAIPFLLSLYCAAGGHTLGAQPAVHTFFLSIVTFPFLTVIASSRHVSTHFMHSIHLQSGSTETGSTAWTPKSLICGMEQLFGHPDTANFIEWW